VAAISADEHGGPLATVQQLGLSLESDVTAAQLSPMPACADAAQAWPATLTNYNLAGMEVYHLNLTASMTPMTAGGASLTVAVNEIAAVTPLG
jgi:hypothetical protein